MESSDLFRDNILEKLDGLEEQIQRLFWFIEFHLGEVPMKYRKLYPSEGEYPYFKPKTDYKVDKLTPKFIPGGIQEFDEPEDKAEYQESLERMKKYAEEKNSHVPDLSDDAYWKNHELWAKAMEERKLRQDSSAASLKPLEPQDSPLACKHPESSQSSNEPPDHNNPPSPSVC